MNITDLDGRSDNYLAEIRRISAINPSKEADEDKIQFYGGRNPTQADENFDMSRSRSRSPIELSGQ